MVLPSGHTIVPLGHGLISQAADCGCWPLQSSRHAEPWLHPMMHGGATQVSVQVAPLTQVQVPPHSPVHVESAHSRSHGDDTQLKSQVAPSVQSQRSCAHSPLQVVVPPLHTTKQGGVAQL
jgi:hypothetical protein